MSDSDSDIGKVSDSNGPSGSSNRRPKRSAPRKSVVESGSSEDEAVRSANKKKSRRSATKSPLLDDMFNADTKEKMSSMNELERELNVYKHMEEMEIKKQREEIRRSMMNKDKSADTKKKGKTSKAPDSDDSDQGKYSSSSESEGEIREPKRSKKPAASDDEDPDMGFHRPSEVHEKRNKKRAMDELLTKRRDKKEQEKKKEQDKNRAVLDIDEIFGGVGGRSSSSSSSSSRSSSVSSRSSSRSPSPEVKREIESLDELMKCKISRQTLARFVHLPFFNKLAVGCYVRVGIGENHGKSVYRIAEITEVVETTKVYSVENTRTNRGLKLKHGADQRVYRLEFVSNQDFDEKEWLQWLQSMRSKNVPLPTIQQINNKQKEIEHYKTYNFTSTDIDYMIKEKQRFLNTPTNFAVEKNRLMREKADAEEQGNLTRSREIQHEIDELDAKADDAEHQRNAKLSAVSLINQKRRDEMKQNFLDPKKINWDPVRQDDPFTRKSNRTKVVSGASKRNKDDDSQGEIDPTTGQKGDSASTTAANLLAASSALTASIENGTTSAAMAIKQKFSSKTTSLVNPTAGTTTTKQFAHHMNIDLDLDL